MNHHHLKNALRLPQETGTTNDMEANPVSRTVQKRVKSKAAGTMAALLKAIPSLNARMSKVEATKEGHVYFFLGNEAPNLHAVACNDDEEMDALINRFSAGGGNV
jgi:hypothetical protein